MFVVLTYDISGTHIQKVMKICRRYLVHVQNSVFEGTITESELNHLKVDLEKVLKCNLKNCTLCDREKGKNEAVLRPMLSETVESTVVATLPIRTRYKDSPRKRSSHNGTSQRVSLFCDCQD